MSKKIAFGAKPTAAPIAAAAESWVANRDSEKTKRMTIDVPESLHARVKSQCALRGTTIAHEVRRFLEKEIAK